MRQVAIIDRPGHPGPAVEADHVDANSERALDLNARSFERDKPPSTRDAELDSRDALDTQLARVERGPVLRIVRIGIDSVKHLVLD
jgi:hypothetical protein